MQANEQFFKTPNMMNCCQQCAPNCHLPCGGNASSRSRPHQPHDESLQITSFKITRYCLSPSLLLKTGLDGSISSQEANQEKQRKEKQTRAEGKPQIDQRLFNHIPDMKNLVVSEQNTFCHVVCMPYPGRGHMNPIINFCKLLVLRNDNILITFVVTEEWLSFLSSENMPEKIRLVSIPNAIPSERDRPGNMKEFMEAVMTKMERPLEFLLDQVELPATMIIVDSFLYWAVSVGNRRNIPVASFWTMSAMIFSVFQHFDLLVQNGHYPVDLLERGEERVDYIPGVSSTRLMDFPSLISGNESYILQQFHRIISWVHKAQYLLFTSIYELEPYAIDALRAKFQIPIYTVGPAVPWFKIEDNSSLSPRHNEINYTEWLNSQPNSSVLYVSIGSNLSISGTQIDEIAAGLCLSGVRFLWAVRGETGKLKEACGKMGLLVPWCDQLKVLSHPCIGGFWTHCGWNSIKEGVFAGAPFLTFPLGVDQIINSKLIEEDLKIGWRVRKETRVENLVTRDAMKGLVRKFMDTESIEVKEMRKRAKELGEMCQNAISEDGSSEIDIKSFIRDIS
ncbi:hypothetical protein Patl1_31013 [Pistacia atlantica]|uniref:Uncharacterized protein n=1 Tax=Pistacia atlantica TaxID=434234 RepID=A0ACC1ABN7_9ROSI|nr:hypothetical protein Patl1_31013 [Pistacia atlantica]